MPLAAVLATVGAASAVPLTFFDRELNSNNAQDPIKFLNSGSSSSTNRTYTGFFDLTLGVDGFSMFDPDSMVITNAVAKFFFADDGDSNLEYVQIRLANSESLLSSAALFIGPVEVDGSHANIPISYDLVSGEFKAGDLVNINDDGKIWFSVEAVKYQSGSTWKNSDTYLKRAELWAYGHDIPDITITVPDAGSTSLLLGGAFAGLLTLRRRSMRATTPQVA